MPIEIYEKQNQLQNKEAIALGVMLKLDLYYVFNGASLVIYSPISDEYKKFGTADNAIAEEGCIETEYLNNDIVPVSIGALNLLYTSDEIAFSDLITWNAPEGFKLQEMLGGAARPIRASSIYIDPSSLRKQLKPIPSQNAESFADRPTNTGLKVIGLLMIHLAKSPKYASGNSPNKSQIKELLIELANEFDINEYGLSKVDERLLTAAMKYLETQKN